MHDVFIVTSEVLGEQIVKPVCAPATGTPARRPGQLCGVEQRGLLATRE